MQRCIRAAAGRMHRALSNWNHISLHVLILCRTFSWKTMGKKNVRMRTFTFCRDHVHPTESSGNGMSLCTECPSCRKLLSSCPWFWWVVSVLILSLPSSTEGWRVQSILIKVSLKRFSIEVSPNTHSFLTFFYYQPLYDNVMNNRCSD